MIIVILMILTLIAVKKIAMVNSLLQYVSKYFITINQ